MGPYLTQPKKQKNLWTDSNQQKKISYAICQIQGWQRSMESISICKLDMSSENSIFCIFNGHGGPEVSQYVSKIFIDHLTKSKYYKQNNFQQAFQQTFKLIDTKINTEEGWRQLNLNRRNIDGSYTRTKIADICGCTANIVLITKNRIITVNIGDSRAVLYRNGMTLQLSTDHKPQKEIQRKRIQAAGGKVINGRVNGELNVSRSFGDFKYKKIIDESEQWKKHMITAKPDYKQFKRQQKDEFIFIGCRGIWQIQEWVENSHELARRIAYQRKQRKGKDILQKMFDYILADDVSQQTGCNNMTAILVELNVNFSNVNDNTNRQQQ